MSAALKIAILLVPLLAARAAYADRQTEDAQLATAFAAAYDPQKIGDIEPALIASSAGRARRDGASLVLTIAQGPAVTLANDESGCEPPNLDRLKCYDFHLLADLPSRHAFLVAQSFDENGDIMLIDDRTGTRSALPDLPRFSPDGALLLVISSDEEKDAGVVQLWNRDGDVVKKLWEAPDTTGADQIDFVAWNDDGIQLDLSFAQGDDKPALHRQAMLTNGKSGWALTVKDAK